MFDECITFSEPMTHSLQFVTKGVTILALNDNGMYYKGQFIQDAGAAHRAWIDTMSELRSIWRPKKFVVAVSGPLHKGIQVRTVNNPMNWKFAVKEAFPEYFDYVKDLHPCLDEAKKQVSRNTCRGPSGFSFEVTEI